MSFAPPNSHINFFDKGIINLLPLDRLMNEPGHGVVG